MILKPCQGMGSASQARCSASHRTAGFAMDYLSTCTMMLDARKGVAEYNMGQANKSFGVADAPKSPGWKGCTYRLGMLPSEHQYRLHPRADTLLCSEYGMGSLVDSSVKG